jgi:hypothetical protein
MRTTTSTERLVLEQGRWPALHPPRRPFYPPIQIIFGVVKIWISNFGKMHI